MLRWKCSALTQNRLAKLNLKMDAMIEALTTNPYRTAFYTLLALPLLATVKVLVHYVISLQFSAAALRRKVDGKNVVITGGSKGLGKGIARVLVESGANVTLVARGVESLKEAQKELQAIAAKGRQVHIQPIDLSKADKVIDGVRLIRKAMGKIDWVIHNAGTANPGFVADQLDQEIDSMIEHNLLSGAYVVKALVATAKEIAEDKKVPAGGRTWAISGLSQAAQEEMPTKLVFVGSVCSVLSFIGFAGYSASKYGQRGFCDGLRSEFKPLGIDVHLFLPANMDTPGFAVEGETKPQITKQIEGTLQTVSPEAAAKALFAGILSDRYLISNDILGELARVGAQGGVVRPNIITETIAAPIIFIAFSIWVILTDIEIKSFFSSAPKPEANKNKKSN
ncbi:3-dehydrosphinganine reductase [Rhizoclosmatium sp. JEL0117]|nr:3-dehydrosphinganine reductase [Rhizoclosmatium sp. JEL0117]